ncbi:hypothetical protein RUM43_007686 [Polyplax serrata]|uniref:Uncharacterized protein n=1 Tax=Polyplax serrata TaxID=468196 RepID=A0AAN8PMM1_POLSC
MASLEAKNDVYYASLQDLLCYRFGLLDFIANGSAHLKCSSDNVNLQVTHPWSSHQSRLNQRGTKIDLWGKEPLQNDSIRINHSVADR